MKGSYHNQKRSTQLVAKGFSTTKLDTMGSYKYFFLKRAFSQLATLSRDDINDTVVIR